MRTYHQEGWTKLDGYNRKKNEENNGFGEKEFREEHGNSFGIHAGLSLRMRANGKTMKQ